MARFKRMQMALFGGLYPVTALCDSQDLPIYRRTDLQNHKKPQDRVWVSYQDGVYDITDFIKVHPGGSDKLMMAAGGAIDPFWQMYPFHKEESVKDLLKTYKIGRLHPDDQIKPENLVDFSDMQKDSISRSINLLTMQDFPYCAETNKEFLQDHFLTPSDEMYLRNHNLVPLFDEDFEKDFRLEIGVIKSLASKDSAFSNRQMAAFDLQTIREQMQHHTVITQITCAGNRRSHTRKVYPDVKGINWDIGAIGNAKYRGVFVRDLLLKAGFTSDELDSDMFKGKHLIATGLDADFQGVPFKISVPMERVLDPTNEVILAFEMNDQTLPADHGYPLRLIVPGYIGVRNCKWVTRLEISDEEADSHPQRRDYRIVKEPDWSKINLMDYPPVNGMVSYACTVKPEDDQVVKLASN